MQTEGNGSTSTESPTFAEMFESAGEPTEEITAPTPTIVERVKAAPAQDPNFDLMEELRRLKAENQALKQRATTGIAMKVSEKGALSVYGLGRFPVTLYKGQWLKLLAMAKTISDFITAHASELSEKPTKE